MSQNDTTEIQEYRVLVATDNDVSDDIEEMLSGIDEDAVVVASVENEGVEEMLRLHEFASP